MEKEKRISILGGIIAISIAFCIDVLQFLLDLAWGAGLVLNPIINVFVYPSYWVWFKFKGVKFAEPKNMSKALVGAIVEMIPILNLLPGLTITVASLVVTVWVEDRKSKPDSTTEKNTSQETDASSRFGVGGFKSQVRSDAKPLISQSAERRNIGGAMPNIKSPVNVGQVKTGGAKNIAPASSIDRPTRSNMFPRTVNAPQNIAEKTPEESVRQNYSNLIKNNQPPTNVAKASQDKVV